MINQLALETAAVKLSPHTGFIHNGDLIPTTDNMLYALALLRTKVADRILEARALIEKLLPFQLGSGNFPVNLHEWPNSYDRFLGAQLLVPMHWILVHFSHVLGKELEQRFTLSRDALRRYLLEVYEVLDPSPLISCKVLAACGDPRCNQILDDHSGWLTNVPSHLGTVLAAYQVIDPTLKRFLPYLASAVEPETLSYAGPPVNEYQAGLEPQPTLFDLYIATLTGTTPKRLKVPTNQNLWAAAIEPVDHPFSPKGPSCNTHKVGTVPENFHKGAHHFRYLWGTPDNVHSLVCQGGTLVDLQVEEKNHLLSFDMTLPPSTDEQERTIAFYCDYQPLTFEVNGKPSTTFTCEDTVILKTKERTFTFTFSPTKGLIGHIMRGNRPSQRSLNGSDRYEAYDWTLFLRSVYREGSTPFHITLHIDETL